MRKSQTHNRKVINKIIKAVNNTKRRLAKEAGEVAHNIFEESVGDFYEAYTPRHQNRSYYRDRTYSLYEAISPLQTSQNGNRYVVRKRVHPGFIDGDPYRADKDFVFTRSFYGSDSITKLDNSIHGFTPQEAKMWSDPNYINRFGEPSRWNIPPSAAPVPSREMNLYSEIMDKWVRWKKVEAKNVMNRILLDEFRKLT